MSPFGMTMSLRLALPFCAVLLLAACGGSEPEPETDAGSAAEAPAEAAATPAPAAPAAAVPSSPADVTLADLDAYERAMAAKTAEIRRATEELTQARADKNQDRELELMMYMSGQALQARTAETSGLDPARYTAVARILQNTGDKLASIQQLNSMMAESIAATEDPQMRAQAEQNAEAMRQQLGDPYAGFTPEVAEALRDRLPALIAQQQEQAGLMLRSAR